MSILLGVMAMISLGMTYHAMGDDAYSTDGTVGLGMLTVFLVITACLMHVATR